jgi:capsular polysaccharide transport system permease protein
MTVSDDHDTDADGRHRAASGPRRLPGKRAGGIVARLKRNLPALFPKPPPAGMPEQLQLLLEMRNDRLRRFLIRAIVFMVVPTLLVLFYTGVIATPRYVSTFEVTYQVYQPTTSVGGGLVPVATSQTDAIDYGAVIYQYVQSETLADKLDQQLHLRDYFSSDRIDWTSRLVKNATEPQYYGYYGNRVAVSEGFGGYLTITVQAFDAAFAQKLAQTINDDSNTMLDGITAQARQAEVQTALEQFNDAMTQLNQANQALTSFRNSHGDLDPSQIATELGTIEGTLESQLASTKAELAQAQANMQPNNSQIVQLNLQVAAIQKEIDSERARLAGADGTSNYSSTVADYETLVSNQQLATTNYQAAQQALLAARADATRKQNYVVDFVSPTLPDRPTAPNPWLSAGETLLACIIGYAVINLLYAALRDQTGV